MYAVDHHTLACGGVCIATDVEFGGKYFPFGVLAEYVVVIVIHTHFVTLVRVPKEVLGWRLP